MRQRTKAGVMRASSSKLRWEIAPAIVGSALRTSAVVGSHRAFARSTIVTEREKRARTCSRTSALARNHSKR